jgi:GntR family transcriptional regulator, carbon starvation induced regulator
VQRQWVRMSEVPLTRAAWVDRRLREAILSGALPPGAKLNTEELARRWSVSPTPLREAYHRLAAEGLVELVPQRGARVMPLSMDDALDIYSLRRMLEPHALRLSLKHHDDAWRGKVNEAFRPLRDLLMNPGDAAEFEDAHNAFHTALLGRCGSPWLLRIIGVLQQHSARYRLLSLGPRGGALEVLAEHENLLAACLSGNVDQAADRLGDHLDLTIDAISTRPIEEQDPLTLSGLNGT